jgi:hypothetical protein
VIALRCSKLHLGLIWLSSSSNQTITVAGGLYDALASCANAVRSNFKVAKDEKSLS